MIAGKDGAGGGTTLCAITERGVKITSASGDLEANWYLLAVNS